MPASDSARNLSPSAPEPTLAISAERRAKWDSVVLVVIVISAFEIPYSILVGWNLLGTAGLQAERAINWLFFTVYFSDVLLNFLAVPHQERKGVWGWRSLCDKVFPTPHSTPHWKRYLVSGWFLIDAAATLPFFLVATELGFLSAARVLRLFRFARLVTTLKLLHMPRAFSSAFSKNPALGRFAMMAVIVPWLWHLHACLLYYAERRNRSSTIDDFPDALHHVFIAFTANAQSDTVTTLGFAVSVSAVVVSVLIVAAVFGNFTALFNNRDHLVLAHIEQRKLWQRFFALYPEAFPSDHQRRILDFLHSKREADPWIDQHREMVESLPSALETEVKASIRDAAVDPAQADRFRDLSKALER